MVVACFASHIHRVQQIIDVALEQHRKIVLMGRSMEANAKLARKLNLLHVGAADLIDIENIDRYAPGEVCVICTGSQGEPLAALAKLSRGDARFLKVGADDTVILSSHPIPGNEWTVGRVIDDLHRAAAEVIHSGHEPVHASGHARQGELRTFHQLLRPQNFVPVHGEYRHMVHHAELAHSMGLSPKHVLICEDGDQIEVNKTGIRRAGQVPAGFHYIDGSAGDLDERPLEERRMLAEFGVVQISAGRRQSRRHHHPAGASDGARVVRGRPGSHGARRGDQRSARGARRGAARRHSRRRGTEQGRPARGGPTARTEVSPPARPARGGRRPLIALFGLAVIGVVASDAPEGLHADRVVVETTVQQCLSHRLHHVELAEEIGVTPIGR